MPTESHIADALIATVPWGDSLSVQRDEGRLESAWAPIRALAQSFDRLIVLSWGDEREEPLGDKIGVEVIACPGPEDLGELTTSLVAMLSGCATAIVRTEQMLDAPAPVPAVLALRDAGIDARLIARAGFVWSRFIARELGPESEEARSAGSMEREIAATADAVSAASQATLDDLCWRYGIDPARTCVVPDCMPVRGLIPLSAREPGLIVSVGELSQRTRMDLIIEAVGAQPNRDELRLEIIGDGMARAELERLAAQWSVNLTITSPENRSTAADHIERATLYVQASRHESDPRFLLEALASGTPCVVADSPGIADLVAHADTGLRCPPQREAFTRMIGGLLTDPEWAEAMGASASRFVTENNSIERVTACERRACSLALTQKRAAA